MSRKRKYAEGSPVGSNGLVLIERTQGGTHPKALFQYPNGEVKEHRIADVAKDLVNGGRVTNRSIIHDFKPGDTVGMDGLVLVRVTEDGKAIFRHPDGHEAEHRIFHVWYGYVTGHRQPARTYAVGDKVGPYGFKLASVPIGGRAVFELPTGSVREYSFRAVERGNVTGRKMGRPKGKPNGWLRIMQDNRDPVLKARREKKNEYQKKWRLASWRKRNGYGPTT